MILSAITLTNFRNHAATVVKFASGINAVLGKNGQGKTNLLEAVSYVGLTKSFYAASDRDVLCFGAEEFTLDARIASDAGVEHRVGVRYTREPSGKSVAVDGLEQARLASVIGRFPVVILSPEHGAITSGGPAERRKFMDVTLSQVAAAYLDDAMEYRRVLRQRNRIQSDGLQRGPFPSAVIEPWTESLARYGGRIAFRRRAFVEEFRAYVRDAYRSILPLEGEATDAEEPDLAYECGFPVEAETTAEGMTDRMAAALASRRLEEQRRGITLAGPHRDEIHLTINGVDVQHFASQGQHKTILVALKIAEYRYMRERRQEAPLLLLDDVFSELDTGRARRILDVTLAMGQSIITATDDRAFGGSIGWGDKNRRFTIEHGTCRPAA